MVTEILKLITIGANIFSDERTRYYENKARKLVEAIQRVEDSDFYKKDMEAKGMAQRELTLEVDSLKSEFFIEAAR